MTILNQLGFGDLLPTRLSAPAQEDVSIRPQQQQLSAEGFILSCTGEAHLEGKCWSRGRPLVWCLLRGCQFWGEGRNPLRLLPVSFVPSYRQFLRLRPFVERLFKVRRAVVICCLLACPQPRSVSCESHNRRSQPFPAGFGRAKQMAKPAGKVTGHGQLGGLLDNCTCLTMVFPVSIVVVSQGLFVTGPGVAYMWLSFVFYLFLPLKQPLNLLQMLISPAAQFNPG